MSRAREEMARLVAQVKRTASEMIDVTVAIDGDGQGGLVMRVEPRRSVPSLPCVAGTHADCDSAQICWCPCHEAQVHEDPFARHGGH